MILYRGEIHDTKEQNRLLDGLENTITEVLQRPAPTAETVVAACDGLARRVLSGEFDGIIAALGLDRRFTLAQAAAAANLLRRDSLGFKLTLELGPDWAVSPSPRRSCPWGCSFTSPPATWTACRLTAPWRASSLAT